MNPFITTVRLNNVQGLPEGTFDNALVLGNKLNIISGENGTGKSLVLSHIKRNITDTAIVSFDSEVSGRVLVFNPKRNSQKQTMLQIAENLRKQGITSKKQVSAIIGQQLDDQNATIYPSFGELFHAQVQALIGTGSVNGIDAVNAIRDEFNDILKKVFPKYQIDASWEASGDQPAPKMTFRKGAVSDLSHERLSCGEREVLSLVFNIFTSKDDVDIYLIDEPEIHLNWSLEKQLFDFFAWFVAEYNKQAIVVSHSRAVFLKDLLCVAKFFVWNGDKISVTESVSEETKKAIGGDSIQIIRSLELHDKTFFVEDSAAAQVVGCLAKTKGVNVGASQVGNSSNVKGLCRVAKDQGITDSLFLIDNDNDGFPNEFLGNSAFVMLKKYCVENYLLDFDLLAKISVPVKTIVEVQAIVNEIVKANNAKNNKAFQAMANADSLVNSADVLDTMDASGIFGGGQLAEKLGLSDRNDLIEKFITQAYLDSRGDEIFSEITSKF